MIIIFDQFYDLYQDDFRDKTISVNKIELEPSTGTILVYHEKQASKERARSRRSPFPSFCGGLMKRVGLLWSPSKDRPNLHGPLNLFEFVSKTSKTLILLF